LAERQLSAVASVGGRLTVLVGGSIGGHVFRWEPKCGIPPADEGYIDHAGALSATLVDGDPSFMAIGDSVGDVHIQWASDTGWRRLAIHDNGVAVLAAARERVGGGQGLQMCGGQPGAAGQVDAKDIACDSGNP
jgi:hypothetical protein